MPAANTKTLAALLSCFSPATSARLPVRRSMTPMLSGRMPHSGTLPPLPDGFLVVDKPANWTSFDVVGKVRGTLEKHFKAQGHTFGRRSRLKVGHGGTLDPLATGFLVLGVGGGTKRLQQYLTGAKGYAARAKLGAETDTQDSVGSVISTAPYAHVTREALEEAAAQLTGPIMQRPPIYSALRKDGKRLHELARAGEIRPEDVEPRPVTVYEMAVGNFDAEAGVFDLRVSCSGGTYIRSLIVEMGRAIGSAAHMVELRRTRHGPFCSVEEAAAQAADDSASDISPSARLASAGVVPVPESALRDPAKLVEAVDEARHALEACGALDAHTHT